MHMGLLQAVFLIGIFEEEDMIMVVKHLYLLSEILMVMSLLIVLSVLY